MQITFYRTSSDPKCLIKDIRTVIGSAHALAPTEQVGCLNPVIMIDYNSSLISSNYCYIDTFNRYYWCNVAVTTAQRMIVSCKVDYLMSWASYIKKCPATIVRAELEGPTYMVDDKLPVDPSRIDIVPYNFPADPLAMPDSEQYKYLLITNGGGESNGS